MLSRLTGQGFSRSGRVGVRPSDLTHVKVCGFMPMTFARGGKFIFMIVDDFTKDTSLDGACKEGECSAVLRSTRRGWRGRRAGR